MDKSLFRWSSLIFIIFFFISKSVFAGQVVTPELSQWAKQALANEQALATSPTSKSVAVLYFQNLTGNTTLDPLQKGFTVMLTTDLAKVKDLQVVERARLQALLEEIELGKTVLVDADTAPRVGRLVGARFLAGGDIVKGSVSPLQVDPSLLDASEQILVNQASAEGSLNDLIAIEKEILFDIIRQMEISLTPDEKAELEKPVSTSIPALMLLFRGINASDNGNYSQATDLFNQALAKDPNLASAKEALHEIKTLNLMPQATDAVQVKPSTSGSGASAAVPDTKSGGLLKYVAIGLGVAAAGAGGYYLATTDSDDDSDPSPGSQPPVTQPPGSQPPQPSPGQPAVYSTTPSDGDTGVSNSLSEIRVVFNKSMDINYGQIITQASDWQVPRTATIEWQNDQVMFIRRLSDNLLPQGDVSISLQDFQDLDGLRMAAYSFFFSVPETYTVVPYYPLPIPVDVIPPIVELTTPSFISCLDGGVTGIKITFNESIDLNRAYTVTPSPAFQNISMYWQGENMNSQLVITWENSVGSCCVWRGQYNDNISELILTLANFYDLSGNALGEQYTEQHFPIAIWPDNCIY